MKINISRLAISSWKFVAISFLIILFSSIPTKAQNHQLLANNIDSTVNSLFTPTSADRFFQEGREQFEEEIQLDRDKYFDSNLLTIDEELLQEIKENQPTQDRELDK